MRKNEAATTVHGFLFAMPLVLALAASPAGAGRLEKEQVPEPLQPWVSWVLEGHESELCPFFQGAPDRHVCAWPSQLTLTLDDKGGTFTQEWRIFSLDAVPLPGDGRQWPLDVKADGASIPVVANKGMPHAELVPGVHTVSGIFLWSSLPELLQIPAETGLVSLTLRGRRIDFPSWDDQGRLWLQKSTTLEEGESRLEVIVHRLVVDDIPLRLVTNVQLKVSGKNREAVLAKPLPAGFVPMSLNGPLPTRLDADGHLRVQVRPGTWEIELVARDDGPVHSITLSKPDAAWDSDEAWVFRAVPDLRIVTIEGVSSIDPQQTQLPQEWRALPAYLMKPGDTMKLVERRRGDAEPQADRLTINRQLWLDFDGDGYSVQDRITGTLSRSWRLEMGPPSTLGRVAVGGRDLFITALAPGAAPGVEIREGRLDLVADSRVEKTARRVPAVSWNHDFDKVDGELHLPPGWSIIHASGVDRATPTWVTEWTLLDLFLLLIISLSIARLWGRAWGALAFVTIALSWQEPVAPRWVWLFILAAEALSRALPEGRLLRSTKTCRVIIRVLLVLIAIPFLLLQARQALYPQLKSIGPTELSDVLPQAKYAAAPASTPIVPLAPNAPMETPTAVGGEANKPELKSLDYDVRTEEKRDAADKEQAVATQQRGRVSLVAKLSSLSNVAAPDPNALVSTGPGLPSWSWKTVELSWQGPVEATQHMRLWLISPFVQFFLSFLRIAIMSALVLCALGLPVGTWMEKMRSRLRGGAAAGVVVVGFAALFGSPIARAENPNPELLQELQKRLLAPPDCSPRCAEMTRLKLEATPDRLALRLEVSAAAETGVPLPGGAQQWTPATVVLDGAPARALLHSGDGVLWLALSRGTHQVVLDGPLPDRETVQLPLPLKPHRVDATVAGWILDGLHEDGTPDDNLQLSRDHAARAGSTEAQGILPPFVRVQRSLQLGLAWQVETRVTRLTPTGSAIVVGVPLLPGESVTSADVRVEDGQATVSMSPQMTEVSWASVLPEATSIELTAPTAVSWVEVWQVDSNPIWHLQAGGIPAIHQQEGVARRVLEWHPWPGEKVAIKVDRPKGVAGQTLTIDQTAQTVSPGIRAADVSVQVSYRSSRGGQHGIRLPEGAELQSVVIDGLTQPVRQEGRTVVLAITPGGHQARISWRQAEGIAFRYRTPTMDVGAPSVNASVNVEMPAERWTLLVGGPRLGPAVLFWSLLIVLLLVSVGLSRIRLTPLRTYQWFLLGLGLTQSPVAIAAIIAIWFVALGARRREQPSQSGSFNLVQLSLLLLTVVALICLFWSVAQGLLGLPEMQISGNDSSAQQLRWYQDRAGNELPHAWVISVPMLIYRFAMLAWALWLALSLIGWLKWGWGCFTEGGMWRSSRRAEKEPLPPPPPPAPRSA